MSLYVIPDSPWAGGSHTELTVRKNRTGYHNHVNSEEVTGLIRELALVCEDTSIVSILNRLGYRTGTGNTWTEKRVQHVRHTNGCPACPPPDHRLWITMQQAAAALRVSEMVVRRLIAQKTLPAKQDCEVRPLGWSNRRTWSFPRCAKRFVEFTRAGVRDGRSTKNKRGYSRISMKLSLDYCEHRGSQIRFFIRAKSPVLNREDQ